MQRLTLNNAVTTTVKTDVLHTKKSITNEL